MLHSKCYHLGDTNDGLDRTLYKGKVHASKLQTPMHVIQCTSIDATDLAISLAIPDCRYIIFLIFESPSWSPRQATKRFNKGGGKGSTNWSRPSNSHTNKTPERSPITDYACTGHLKVCSCWWSFEASSQIHTNSDKLDTYPLCWRLVTQPIIISAIMLRSLDTDHTCWSCSSATSVTSVSDYYIVLILNASENGQYRAASHCLA